MITDNEKVKNIVSNILDKTEIASGSKLDIIIMIIDPATIPKLAYGQHCWKDLTNTCAYDRTKLYAIIIYFYQCCPQT